MPEQKKEHRKKEHQKKENQSESRENTYYQPKTDRSQSVLLNRIEQYNQYLNHRDFGRNYLMNPAGKMLKTPSRQLTQAAVNEKDEEAAGIARAAGHTRIAGSVLGAYADKARIRKTYQDTVSIGRYLKAEKIFVRDPFTEAGSIFHDIEGFSMIDPEKVTHGDLKMFQYRLNHPDVSMEKLLSVRKEANARHQNGGKIDYEKLGRRNGLRKRIDRLAGLSEINAFMEFSKTAEVENPQLFTPVQKNILYREAGFMEVVNPVELTANMTLIRQMLKMPSLAGEFSHFDPEGLMNERDIRRLLKGQIPGLKLEKAKRTESGKKPGRISGRLGTGHTAESGKSSSVFLDEKRYHLLHGGLKALLWNQGSYRKIMEMRKSLSARESIKGWAFREFKQELMEDEEFAAMSAYVDHALPVSVVGAKMAVTTGKTAGKAAGTAVVKSGAAAGNAVVYGLHKMGNEVEAEAVRALGEGIARAGKAMNDRMDDVLHLPGRAVRSVEKQAAAAVVSGAKILAEKAEILERTWRSTKTGKAITQSRVYRGIKAAGRKTFHGFRQAGHIVRTTSDAFFRSSGAAFDSVKQWLIKPAAIFIGFIVFLQLILAAVFGGMGGASVVTVTVFDTPEHFNNPDYTIPEEMGFQQRYEQAQVRFQSQIDGIINGYAKTLNKKGRQIPYGVNGANNQEGCQNDDYVSGVTMEFDAEKSNNLEEILSCVAVIMQQKQAEYHAEALELVDCFYQSSHTYDYTESPLYSCASGCEITSYFCNEAEEGYPSTEMKFAPYLHGDLFVPEESNQCEVDRENPEMKFSDYAGCVAAGTCFHNSGDKEDNFGRRKPQKSTCSNPEAFWSCKHECTKPNCTHDCSRSVLGCGGYWYCGGHDHYGCPDGHEVKTCFGHVNMEMNIQMKTMEELFALGGVEVNERGSDAEDLEGSMGMDVDANAGTDIDTDADSDTDADTDTDADADTDTDDPD